MTTTEPRRLRTDVLFMLIAKTVAMALNVVSTIIIARALGVEGRGAVAVAFSLTLLIIQFGTLGMVTANPYFAARDAHARARIAANSIWLAFVVGGLGIAVAVLLKLAVPSVTQGLGWPELLVAVAGVPFALLAVFLQSILLGEGRTLAMNGIEVAVGFGSIAALAVGLLVFDVGVIGAIAIMTGSYVVSAVAFGVVHLHHRWELLRPDAGLTRSMLKYGFRIYVATLIGFLVVRLDLLLVNAYLGQREAGLYSVAAALAHGMYVIPSVVGTNLFPRIARGGPDEMSAEVFRSVSLLYGAICLVTAALAPAVVPILFGTAFDGAVELYWWLVPGIFALGMLTILSNHFAGRGFPLEAMLVWFVGLAINVAMNLVLLERHGTWIASLSASVAYLVLLVLHMRMFARDAGGYAVLRPSPRETVRFVRVALSRGR